MSRVRHLILLGSLLACALLLTACNDDSPTAVTPPVVPADAVPDFSLVDVNATSPTANQAVSPRDHLQEVSGWYFGHAT